MIRLLSITCCALLSLPGLAMESPLAVSPAHPDGIAVVASPCPTFSWTALDGARGYELVVYRVEGGAPVGEPVLETFLPRGASSWTPSAERCLEPGGTYAWVVRGVDDQETGEWSHASLFTLPARPAPEELEAALEVVRRHLAATGELPEVEAPPAVLVARPPVAVMSPAEEAPAELATKATSADFSVSGDGHTTSRKLTVGSNTASATNLATFANSDFNAVRVRIGGRNLLADVGPTLELDATGSFANGRSFSLISTANNANVGPGKLAVWDDTSDIYRLLIDGVNDVTKIRNLALTTTRHFDSVFGSDRQSASCLADEVLTGGGCTCTSGEVKSSRPEEDGAGPFWFCVCSSDTGIVSAYAMCLKSTSP